MQNLSDTEDDPDYVKNFDPVEYCRINFIVCTIVSVVAFIYMCVLIKITNQVLKLLGQNRKWNLIALMMICHCFQALGAFIQFVVNSIIFYTEGRWEPTNSWSMVVTLVPVTFYSLAVIINIRNWINYYFKIEQMAAQAHPGLEVDLKYHKRMMDVIGVLCAFFFVAISVYAVMIGVEPATTEEEMKAKIENTLYVYGVELTIVGLTFGISSIMINLRIKKYFPDFYSEYSCLMWTVCFFLSIPQMMRGALDFARAEIAQLE